MNKVKFLEKYGEWALVTGASSGIGVAFAEELAGMGFNLVMVARRGEAMKELGSRLAQQYGIEYKVLAIDLTEEGFYAQLDAELKDLQVGLLVNNAGMNCEGAFYRGGLERNLRMIRLNVEASFILAHELGKRFVDRGKGGILFVSSISAFQPTPYFTHYAATKAYILSLAESMEYELRPKGVDVSALCPGPTESEMSRGLEGQPYVMKADKVVRAGLNGLGNSNYVVPGWGNKIATSMPRLIGRKWSRDLMGAVLKRGLPANRK